MSGSAAQEVKFWEWAVASEEGSQARQLTVNNTRTLKMTEDVLCVRISPNGMPCRVHRLIPLAAGFTKSMQCTDTAVCLFEHAVQCTQ